MEMVMGLVLDGMNYATYKAGVSDMIKIKTLFITLSVLSLFASCAVTDLSAPENKVVSPTDDMTAPVPGNSGYVQTLLVLGSSMKLKWTKADDANSYQSSLQYCVIGSTNTNIDTISNAQTNGMVLLDWTNDIDEFTVTNLLSLTSYYFLVLVRDEWGNTTNYQLRNRATVMADGNYLSDPSFETVYWNYNWYPTTSGILHLQGGHIHTGSYGMYMYTSSSASSLQCESWLDFTDNSRGKGTLYTIPWNPGEAAIGYVWYKIWYNIPDLVVANYHVIVTFYSSNKTKLYTMEQRAVSNNTAGTWETNNLYLVTAPAPAGTAYAELTIGMWKAAGDLEQLLMTVDDAYLSVYTN